MGAVNIIQHSYFNLKGAGQGNVLSHEAQIFADEYTPAPLISGEYTPAPAGQLVSQLAGTEGYARG